LTHLLILYEMITEDQNNKPKKAHLAYIAFAHTLWYSGLRKMSMKWMWIQQHRQFKLLLSILCRRLRSTATYWCWYFWSTKRDMTRYLCLAKYSQICSWYKKYILTFPLVLFQAKACSSASIARLKNVNRRTVDVLASRLYFYYSYSYELTNNLAEIRGWVTNLFQFCPILFISYQRNGHELEMWCFIILVDLLYRQHEHWFPPMSGTSLPCIAWPHYDVMSLVRCVAYLDKVS